MASFSLQGFSPNSTTYNALISAYGKAGQLDRVMEVFHEMMYRGCERNVITYSSLISACEKAGQWELALELFQEMVSVPSLFHTPLRSVAERISKQIDFPVVLYLPFHKGHASI